MIRSLVFGAALGLAFTAPVFAETTARPGTHDKRVTYATYQAGEVYKINVALRSVTLVELGDGETIKSVAIGDLESFKIDRLDGPNLFIIKPTIAGASTNVTVETNRRIYFLSVTETSKVAPAFSVKFSVPKTTTTPADSEIPAGAPLTYVVLKKGATRTLPQFSPTQIHDDGRKTYFKIAAGSPMPAIFRADSRGREFNVNATVRGTTITVAGRSERWVLRYDTEYVCVEGRETTNVK